MKTIALLLLGIILGAGAFWYFTEGQRKSPVREVQDSLVEGAAQVKEKIQDAVEEYSISAEDIRKEIEEKGTVVRQKAREVGSAVADATADARISAKIKGRLALNKDLSALKISVSTTEGLVTLSGTVSTYEDVGQAMKVALETEGVREVISTLQVRQHK